MKNNISTKFFGAIQNFRPTWRCTHGLTKRLVAILIFLVSASGMAKNHEESDSVAIYGNVVDSFTREILKGVHVEILQQDSVPVLDFYTNAIWRFGGYAHNIDKLGYLYIPRIDCILRLSKKEYETQYVNLGKDSFHRREKRMFIGEILLKKKRKFDDNELGTATVTASKIMMTIKGDTLVYNADAFQLAQGSMLDGLVKMLPGVELQGGVIHVDGKRVSSLLINGDDFFKGDPRVALENLPAYMVDKVKVYRKENDWSYISKARTKDDLPLVMDVNLKKQYAIGWVGNTGLGYGTNHRFLARLFGLRFTKYSRLAIYGNANNTNDTKEPGVSGDWNEQSVASGQTKMQTGGFEAMVKDKKGKWNYTGNLKVFHQNFDDRTATSSETFQPATGNGTFSRLRNESFQRAFRLQTAHTVKLKNQMSYANFNVSAEFQRKKRNAEMLGAEFSRNPNDSYRGASLDSLFFLSSERLSNLLINSRRNRIKEHSNSMGGKFDMTSILQIPHTPDFLSIKALVDVNHQENTSFSEYLLHFKSPITGVGNDLTQKPYFTAPIWSMNAQINMQYNYRLDKVYIVPYLDVTDKYHHADRNFYRLELLTDETPALGCLPSTMEALNRCLDVSNTYQMKGNKLWSEAGATFTFWLPGKISSHNISIKPAVQWRTERLSYQRDALNAHPRRSEVVFVPQVSWGGDDISVEYRLNYAYPELLDGLDYTDNADPLNLFRGNVDLKRSTSHSLTFHRYFNNYKTKKNFGISGGWNMVQNAIAHAVYYEQATGIRTYMPRNVNGNWRVNMGVNYSKPFGKKKQTVFSTATEGVYHNSVDYVTTRSSVRNFTINETLKLKTRIKKCMFDWNVGMKYLHATLADNKFSNINSYDLKYGMSVQTSLPVGFALNADATLYHRMGYSDESMNDVHFIANARLSKSLLKGKLDLAIDAFDIFHSLSNVTRILNAQGITETWHNSLLSYVMLHATLKLSKQPKRNK